MALEGISNKQKLIAAALVVIVAFIVWQVMGMFGGGGSTTIKPSAPSAVPKPVPGQSAPAAGATPGAAMSANPLNPNNPAAGGNAPQVMPQANVYTIPNESTALKAQQQDQKAYLDELNKLQVLKVQREIAETSQAIATAKLATATADKNMSDLLTKPAAPTLPASYYANSLGGGSSPFQGPPTPQTKTTAAATPAPAVVEPPYVVISVSMQFNKWNAVLGVQGKLYVVSMGDVLPDGSTVESISKDGVIIGRDGKKRKLSIVSSI